MPGEDIRPGSATASSGRYCGTRCWTRAKESRAAIGEGTEEIQRIGVAHGHHQERGIAPAQSHLDLGDEREIGAAEVAADRAFGPALIRHSIFVNLLLPVRYRNGSSSNIKPSFMASLVAGSGPRPSAKARSSMRRP
jgi:hypothetical protein